MENTPPPNLRRQSLLRRVLDRFLHHEAPCEHHCRCVERMRVKVSILFWLFLLGVGAFVRQQIAELSTHVRWIDPGPPSALVGQDPRK